MTSSVHRREEHYTQQTNSFDSMATTLWTFRYACYSKYFSTGRKLRKQRNVDRESGDTFWALLWRFSVAARPFWRRQIHDLGISKRLPTAIHFPHLSDPKLKKKSSRAGSNQTAGTHLSPMCALDTKFYSHVRICSHPNINLLCIELSRERISWHPHTWTIPTNTNDYVNNIFATNFMFFAVPVLCRR